MMALVKGWIGDAATELQETSLREVKTSIGLEQIQHVISKHYRAKLARGPLGSGEGALMPVPRCDECKFWVANDAKDEGVCRMHSTEFASGLDAERHTNEVVRITTYAEFGCTRFQSQTPAK
jgi:hypothetical protein